MEDLTYEAAQAELQQIVSALQEGTIPLDELEPQLIRAARLLQWCQEKLRQTEQTLEGLFGTPDGE